MCTTSHCRRSCAPYILFRGWTWLTPATANRSNEEQSAQTFLNLKELSKLTFAFRAKVTSMPQIDVSSTSLGCTVNKKSGKFGSPTIASTKVIAHCVKGLTTREIERLASDWTHQTPRLILIVISLAAKSLLLSPSFADTEFYQVTFYMHSHPHTHIQSRYSKPYVDLQYNTHHITHL